MELISIPVVKQDVKLQNFLDDGNWVLSSNGGESAVAQDQDGDGGSGVDLVGELSL